MLLSEIYNQKWKIAENLEVRKIRSSGFERVEQEFHINLLASGYEDKSKEEIHICCSLPRWITRLASNINFKLTSILISCGLEEGNDRVLQVTGVIYDSKLLVLKFSRRTYNLTEEQRQKLNERLKKARDSKGKASE